MDETKMDKKNILREIAKKSGVDMILITDPCNLRYYTGFRGGEGMAALTQKSTVLITDSRYTEEAQQESTFDVAEYSQSRPAAAILNELIQRDHVTSIGIEDEHLVYADYHRLHQQLSGVRLWIALGNALQVPRQIKTEEELSLLRQAEQIGDEAFQDVLKILKPGMTELEVAAELEYSMKKHGAEGLSFDTIAASGVHSSMPHAIPSRKKLEKGDFLTMDFGCRYQGYCSDMTRTVCIGRASEEQKKVYQIVLDAHLRVLEQAKPGMVCRNVDAIARNVITQQGYGEFFGHGLGHSVGLYIHESPFFNVRDTTVLKKDMIETDEPGIYLPGRFGVRIEDMIHITEDGCESFASSPKDLIEI